MRTQIISDGSFIRNRLAKFKSIQRSSFVFLLMICFQTFISQQIFSQPLAAGTGRFLGAGSSYYFWRYFDSYWNQMSPGNEGKWGSVTNTKDVYNWTNLDILYNYATSSSRLQPFYFKEHTLIWGSQAPSWISSLDSATQRASIENWFKVFGIRYPLTYMVDVVNEPFHQVPSFIKALGGNGTTGYDWVITSFQLARKYMPSGCKLLLNEYGVLANDTMMTKYINLIKLLKDRSLIDGVGIQGHYFEFRSHTDATNGTYVNSPATLKSDLNRIAAVGLPIYITEFDIDESNDASQLAQYQIYFPVFWNNASVKGITFWGYIQGDVWSSHPYTYLIRTDGTERPAMQWLRAYILKPITPVVLSPLGTNAVQRNPILKWQSSKSATSYRVQVSNIRTFASVVYDTTTTDTVLQLKPLDANTLYYWHASAINANGSSEYTDLLSFTTNTQIVAVEEKENLPQEFELHQNYPNPFNPSTVIGYQLPAAGYVTLKVYDVLGKEITTLVNEYQQAGNYSSVFNTQHSAFSSGIYFYTLKTGSYIQTKKMILMK